MMTNCFYCHLYTGCEMRIDRTTNEAVYVCFCCRYKAVKA